MKKVRVHLLLNSEELAKFRKYAESRYSNLSREVNLFIKEENRKLEEFKS